MGTNHLTFLCRNEIMAKLLAVTLSSLTLWLPQSVLASECVTVSSDNDPSRGAVTCKRVARSSMNGIGFWRCCPQTDVTND